jgi:solute carrier family 5 (high affinity choline transporter), member 7
MAVAVIGVLYAVFLVIGWRAARKARDGSTADLILAGRAMPLWLATLTMTATWVDGGYLLGTSEGTFKSSLASGIQGGVCFGLSLILGGIFFAHVMRRHEFTTLIDPFEARFGPRWAAALFVPAMLAEVFWSAELLVAIGSTFGVILDMPLTTAILISAAVVTAYTMAGGMWSVAYTDAVQLALVALGLAVALPFALDAAGGFGFVWEAYRTARADRGGVLPYGSFWTAPLMAGWWDLSLMLILGGIPWNCYFQRVLACESPVKAQWHSLLAGVLTMLFTIPPLLLGIAAFSFPWSAPLAAELAAEPARTLPLLLRHATPPLVALCGLAAIVGAVTSSFSASILSAGAMFSWNVCKRLLRPDLTPHQVRAIIRTTIALLGGAAVVLALKVRSVQALWYFTSDLVFVLLFPQLVFALFDRRTNAIGSQVAFAVSLALRVGAGEPLLALPPLIPYPELFAWLLPGDPRSWYDADTGGILFPHRTLAAIVGLVLIPTVSRLTAHWSPPRALRNVATTGPDRSGVSELTRAEA